MTKPVKTKLVAKKAAPKKEVIEPKVRTIPAPKVPKNKILVGSKLSVLKKGVNKKGNSPLEKYTCTQVKGGLAIFTNAQHQKITMSEFASKPDLKPIFFGLGSNKAIYELKLAK
jgi:hypothetical protein